MTMISVRRAIEKLSCSGEGFVVRVISSSEVSLFSGKLRVAAAGCGSGPICG